MADFNPKLYHSVGVQNDLKTNKPRLFGHYALYYDSMYVGSVENPSTTKWVYTEVELAEKTKRLLAQRK